MKKSKKLLLTALSVALVAVIAVFGTVAYLMDTDSDVNVMTLGNVQIEQNEYEWKEGALVKFTQAKPLYPYVGNMAWDDRDEEHNGAYRTFAMNNVVDKYVTVENTGKSPAYVRTFIALEMGEYSYNEFNMVGISNNSATGVEFPNLHWQWNNDFVAEIDGHNYYVMVAVHDDPVAPGVETIPSLLQVYLSKDATNETVEKLDGNGNGTYDILVFSEAVQTNGFNDAVTALNTAFYVPDKDNHPWAGEGNEPEIPAVATTADELEKALTKGGEVIISGTITDTELEAYSDNRNVVMLFRPSSDTVLSGGKIVLDNTSANWGFTVDLKNNVNAIIKDTDLVGKNDWNMHNIVAAGSILTIENVDVTATGGNGIYVTGGGKAVINNSSVAQDGLNEGAQPWAPTAVATSTGSDVTINSGTYVGTTYGVYIYNSGATVTINGGTFKAPQVLKADGSYTDQNVKGVIVVNDGNFDGQINMTNGYAHITINGGTFTNFSVSTYSPVVINGGTFDADPSEWVDTNAYNVTEANGLWTVTAK